MGEGDIPLGTKFAMLGMSPTNKKVLPCGVEVEVTQFGSERRRVHVRRAHRNEAIQKLTNKDRTWTKKRYHTSGCDLSTTTKRAVVWMITYRDQGRTLLR